MRRNLELARREDELARNAHEQSEAAQRFALRQVDEGLREYFLRVAGRAEMDSRTHASRARRFEVIASSYRATPVAAERAMSQANVELVKQVVAAALRCDFDVAPEHLSLGGTSRATAPSGPGPARTCFFDEALR